jgi:hypothetical protein
MLAWLGDLGRLYWGLLYWNSRKTLFRLRGASGRAPCQHPSDSGAAGKTGCEACSGWRSRQRFRRLCPLLAETDDGRRVCSVGAAQVRPFWGRAVLVYGGSLAAAAVLAVLSVYVGFRVIGYRVPLGVVAWPPAWGRIQQARADYFYRMALSSFASGDVRQSYLALNQVYALDPSNSDAARLLAQFTQVSSPDYSDAIYTRLILEHHADFEQVAQTWFRALVARGDLVGVRRLSARMLRVGAVHVPAWTQALLFSERMTGDTDETDRLLAGPEPIPAEARSVLELQRSLRTGDAAGRQRALTLYIGGATATFEIYFALYRLIDLGRAADVAAFVEGKDGAALDAYDREAIKLAAYSALGWNALAQKEVDLLLENGVTLPAITLVCSNLIRYPDSEGAERVFARLDRAPLPATVENTGAHMALLCMAGVNGLKPRGRQEADTVGRIVGGSFPVWSRVRDFFEAPTDGKNPATVLPVLAQLPLEAAYALIDHYHAAAP